MNQAVNANDTHAITATNDAIRELAITTGKLTNEGNGVGAHATFEKMMNVYVDQMALPYSRAWASLPSLDDVKKLMVDEFSSYEGITAEKSNNFERMVDGFIRNAFEEKVPALRKINVNPAVSLDTMKTCVGNLMLERDKASEALNVGGPGILAKVRSRFMASNGPEWGAEFMKSVSSATFAHAVAHTASSVARAALSGERAHVDSHNEVSFLADVAEKHAGSDRHKTLSLISDVRLKGAELENKAERSLAFA